MTNACPCSLKRAFQQVFDPLHSALGMRWQGSAQIAACHYFPRAHIKPVGLLALGVLPAAERNDVGDSLLCLHQLNGEHADTQQLLQAAGGVPGVQLGFLAPVPPLPLPAPVQGPTATSEGEAGAAEAVPGAAPAADANKRGAEGAEDPPSKAARTEPSLQHMSIVQLGALPIRMAQRAGQAQLYALRDIVAYVTEDQSTDATVRNITVLLRGHGLHEYVWPVLKGLRGLQQAHEAVSADFVQLALSVLGAAVK